MLQAKFDDGLVRNKFAVSLKMMPNQTELKNHKLQIFRAARK